MIKIGSKLVIKELKKSEIQKEIKIEIKKAIVTEKDRIVKTLRKPLKINKMIKTALEKSKNTKAEKKS